MKAIVATGWTPTLIPDDYIQNAFFKKELDELDAIEIKIAAIESELSEVLDEIDMDENGDEENGKTLKSAKSDLKEQIVSLKDTGTETAQKEKASLQVILTKLEAQEKDLKAAKKSFKAKEEDLDKNVEEKRKTFAEAEAKQLILQKFRDAARNAMYRYLNSEKKRIAGIFEKLWDKYKVSLEEVVREKERSTKSLYEYFETLNYLN
jgi:type I restriction enzyme M protein